MKWPKQRSPAPGGRGHAIYREPFFARATRWLRRIGLALAIMIGLGATGYASRLFYRFTTTSEFFRVAPDRIDIRDASPELLAEARADLGDYLQSRTNNLCRLRTREVSARLATLPRARAASVRKVYPDGLIVQFTERKPLMLASVDKHLFLIDDDAVLLGVADAKQAKTLGLPILTGLPSSTYHPGAHLNAPHLHDILAAARFISDGDPTLRGRIVEWNTNNQHEVTAMLRGGTEVRFGDRAPLEMLDKLSAVLDSRPTLATAQYLDLRMDKQIVLKRK